MEMEWRQILSLSEKELTTEEKEQLSYNIAWMEADDIELNFSDLKSLFRLAQDTVKFKNEQVKDINGKLEMYKRSGRKKSKTIESEKGSGTQLETITHQEELINENKKVIEQLYADIAELEEKRAKLEGDKGDSDSSRDPLSEMAAIDQLENELTNKNRHIRKLLSDIKACEEENSHLKNKLSILKDKLSEATTVIENLTDQLYKINNEASKLRESLGKSQEDKTHLHIELESMNQKLSEAESDKDALIESLKNKVLHWKNVVRNKKAEYNALSDENQKLKNNLLQNQTESSETKPDQRHERHIDLLQAKLADATKEMINSTKLIELLKDEIKRLKANAANITEYSSLSEMKHEDIDESNKNTILKLKKTINELTKSIKESDENLALREMELSDVRSELLLLKSGDEGVSSLMEELKSKNRQLKQRDDKIKSFVQEVNDLNKILNDIQLENETLREKLNINPETKIPVKGILRKFYAIEENAIETKKKLNKLENNYTDLKIEKRSMDMVISKLKEKILDMGCSKEEIEDIINLNKDIFIDIGGGGDASNVVKEGIERETPKDKEMQAIADENEGLRKGLQEILDFLKDTGADTSGTLALQCPSLEAVLRCMEARHAAGWFAPHMAVVLELRTAIGGRDALLTALNDARKETYEVMGQLKEECKKSSQLEERLRETEHKSKSIESKEDNDVYEMNGVFGSWMDQDLITNFNDKTEINNAVNNKNKLYDIQLKTSLEYFHKKFNYLYQRMTEIGIQAADDQNKWTIKEENYKAEIEKLKGQVNEEVEEDLSDNSPGVIEFYPDPHMLQRKCSYLEENYKYIRTMNENIKNEYLDFKRESMIATADYENKIQNLILRVASLSEKLRNSIFLDTFLKQNELFQNLTHKYRKLLESERSKIDQTIFIKKLEEGRFAIYQNIVNKLKGSDKNVEMFKQDISYDIMKQQLETVCSELEEAKTRIIALEQINDTLEANQSKLIDNSLTSFTNEEINLLKDQIKSVTIENEGLKEQCRHVTNQLDIALYQLQDHQRKQMSNDMEINMLRHQVLDLQSTGDNKAIIARLSSEILISHIQASDNHKKIEKLHLALSKKKHHRVEAEEILKSREKIFDVYTSRYEKKFRYMLEIMNTLRQQYHGNLPMASLENYINTIEDLNRKNHEVNEKLNEVEDLRASLTAKHEVFDELLDFNKIDCVVKDENCPHNIQKTVNEAIHKREIDHSNRKIAMLEQTRLELISRCNSLEKTLILLNQTFHKKPDGVILDSNKSDSSDKDIPELEIEDIDSDEEQSARRSETITLPKPQVLKPNKNIDMTTILKDGRMNQAPISNTMQNHVFTQTQPNDISRKHKYVQTNVTKHDDKQINNMKDNITILEKNIDIKTKELAQALISINQRTDEIINLKTKVIDLESKIKYLEEDNKNKFNLNTKLQNTVTDLNAKLIEYQNSEFEKANTSSEETKQLLEAMKKLEIDKQSIIKNYKDMLKSEREEYANNIKDNQNKIYALQAELNRRSSDSSNNEAVKDVISKYNVKIVDLEDKNFKLLSNLDGCRTELSTYQSELERWKSLASERLHKMEQLGNQLEQRHNQEVESYKAENDHWVSQVSDCRREQAELRTRLNEQRAAHLKLIAEKDAYIERLTTVVHNLKTQIVNMQTVISSNDPSFDLSAIIEVDEGSDALSQQSDRLEIKFDSTFELDEYNADGRMPASSSSIWQETVIDRLRREKHLIGKQNTILRRQIKALAGRERRARLETQNLKNQVYRISTTGNKTTTAESSVLQNKIAALQAQLANARKDTQSSVALWDKWKRSQQASERWQAKFAEKCREVKKFETSLNFTKSAVTRLEREKRVLLSKLSEYQRGIDEKELAYEMREEKALCDAEGSEKDRNSLANKISVRALMERVEAQQRRIVALELAETGNEPLVSEYEKALAEITSLKGQILRLESSVLESQIRIPTISSPDPQPELDYWKSYCDMLKEENIQLSYKLSLMEAAPATSHTQRVSDLEQTVLTLRGLVNKLQSEQKSVSKRGDTSRPSSGQSTIDKTRNQVECYRTELANLKKSISDKDLLLERSKEMLKIAAEREEDLLRENAYLQHRLKELTKAKAGFLSA